MAINPLLYGVKEVADVLFYPVGSSTPTIFFDTLKISNMEFSGETVYARGGKGNPKLIGWDYNREIMLSLQDALISQEFLAMLAGDSTTTTAQTIVKTDKHVITTAEASASEYAITAESALGLAIQYVQQVDGSDGSVTVIADADGQWNVKGKEIYIGDGDGTTTSFTAGDRVFVTYSYTSGATTVVTAHTVTSGEATADAFTLTAASSSGLAIQYVEQVAAIGGTVTVVTDTDGQWDVTGTTITIGDGDGTTTSFAEDDVVTVTYTYTSSGTETIVFNSSNYPGTYKVIGDTVIRDSDGTDHGYQFIIHKAKLQPGFTMTMEAEGDPSVFDLSLDVLANDDGDMIELIKY